VKIKTSFKKAVLLLLIIVLAGAMLASCTLDKRGLPQEPKKPKEKGPDDEESTSTYITISDFFDMEDAEAFLGEEILISTIDSFNNSWCCGSDFYTQNLVLIIKLYQPGLVKPDDTFVGGEGQWHEFIEKKKVEIEQSDSALYEGANMTRVDGVGDIAFIATGVQGHNWGYYEIFYKDNWLHIELQFSGAIPEDMMINADDFKELGYILIENVKALLG